MHQNIPTGKVMQRTYIPSVYLHIERYVVYGILYVHFRKQNDSRDRKHEALSQGGGRGGGWEEENIKLKVLLGTLCYGSI